MYQMPLETEIIVDNFAGGGGASTGIEEAFNRPVTIAINHDAQAIGMHQANHPHTKHFCEDVFDIDPVKVCAGRPVGLAWFSPDCKHFSKAKGGKPVDRKIRGLAWVVTKWAEQVRPRIIMLENVEEFQTWGPLGEDGKPCLDNKGATFNLWVSKLRDLGYKVEWKVLRACDFGAPTIRKRLFLVARCDGKPIIWPEPTHGKGLLPYHTAAECIDWSIPCQSIFGRKRPLAEKTMQRIAKGMKKFVIGAEKPFIAPAGACVIPHLTEHANGSTQRVFNIEEPLRTQCAQVKGGHFALVTSYISKMRGTNIGHKVTEPLHTISAGGTHHAEVRAFLIKYYGAGGEQKITDPCHTITTKDRLGLVVVKGELYRIEDIGMRMLQPRELFRAQGFPDSYIIDKDCNGKATSKQAQVRMCGNSVCPPVATALIKANMKESILFENAA